jgi:hypothetical protein
MLDEARGGKSGQYGRFPTWAAALPGLGGRTLAVLAAIAHHADAEGRAFPGMSRIASLAGIKRTKVPGHEAKLRAANKREISIRFPYCSQSQSSPEVIGGLAVADAILDRIIHHAHRIDLKGESLRG